MFINYKQGVEENDTNFFVMKILRFFGIFQGKVSTFFASLCLFLRENLNRVKKLNFKQSKDVVFHL